MEEQVYGGRYRTTEKIGSGGMADVYKAVDSVLGRTVAVKVLHPRYASDPTFVARFRQEAQAAANLSNPHIVNIYDWGQEDTTYYIVMEYVRGTDLKSLIDEKGPVDPVKAAEYAAQVCSALATAHGYDIVHRDIKPHNIVLTPDGTVKVMDFGIARAGNTTMTQTGSVLGTAQYISPEQAQGRPIGPSSDLYSLGVVLYELTTGRLPFTGDTPVAVALKQVNEQPVPPRRINPAIPPALEAVILRAMQKDPATRYASADEMRDDLRRVIAGQPVVAPPALSEHTTVMPAVPVERAQHREVEAVRRRGGSPWAWIAALIALVLLGGLLAWAVFNQPKNAPVPDVTNMPLSQAQATLTKAGLKVGPVTRQNDTNVQAGSVISESPPAGTPVPAETTITLVVSAGPKRAQVPDLNGLTQQDALNRLRSAGFTVGNIGQANSDSPAGTVIAQNPDPGTLLNQSSPPASVDITISAGPSTATVPDVTGKTEADARSTLEGDGFAVRSRTKSSSDVAKGLVISTDPAPGASVKQGSRVTITVSSGPATVTVPNVKGQGQSAAESALTALGLQVTTTTMNVSDPAQDGRVVNQNPLAGTNVTKGSTVTIFVGKFSGSTPTSPTP